MPRFMPRSNWGLLAGVTAAGLLSSLLALEILVRTLPLPDLARVESVSPIVTASDGGLLRAYLTEDGAWRLRTTRRDVAPHFADMLVAYEDKRFYRHNGVDLLAMARAASQLLRHGRIVSGASTISMQTIRLLRGPEKGWFGKFVQSILALKLERRFSKEQILSVYMTLAPYGGNVEGVRMAAMRYFAKEPRDLSIAEAAMLIALPQSPERRRPDLNPAASQAARNFVLRRVAERGALSVAAASDATRMPLSIVRGGSRFLAYHLADRLRAENPDAKVVRTTIDRALQARVEAIMRELVDRQTDPANAAVVVVRHADMAVRAYVGGSAYYDASRAGMVDLVRSIRSPGSTLKPFIYGLAFEELIVHPQTIVTDELLHFHDYSPGNFDKTYRGELTIRNALIQSVNTVAVALLQRVGPEKFLARLRHSGTSMVLPNPEQPSGLAVALGGVGTSLEDLAKLYAGLAHAGIVRPLRFSPAHDAADGSRILSEAAAWAVTDILADLPPPDFVAPLRSADGGRRIAYKTGTSYGFRDAWSVGFDANHTVAVWTGRPDGGGRIGETGAQVAAPIMFRIFDLLPRADRDVAAERPAHSALAQRSGLASRLDRYAKGERRPDGSVPPRLAFSFPADGATIALGRADGSFEPLVLAVKGGHPPYRWYADGVPLSGRPDGARVLWTPDGPGQVVFSVVDAQGGSASASVWLEQALPYVSSKHIGMEKLEP